MSRFNYKNRTVISRSEVVEVHTGDFTDVLQNNDFNRVQKVMEIRDRVRHAYLSQGFQDVQLKFAHGVVQNLVDSNKLEGRPIPSVLLFEVELYMPLVIASNVPVGLKSEAPGGKGTDYRQYGRSYKDYGAYKGNDHIYWS